MKRCLLLFCILINYLTYSQLVWQGVNTGDNATINVGVGLGALPTFDPTLNGSVISDGSLIAVFFINNDGDYTLGGGTTWLGPGSPLALAAWGTESGFDNGFSSGESFNWFLRVCDSGDCWTDLNENNIIDADEVLDGVDYISNDAVMLDMAGLSGDTYVTNGMYSLESASFVEYSEEELEECTCVDGTTTNIVSGFCFIPVGGCSDSSSLNYCYVGDLTPIFQAEDCQYEGAVSGCMCELSFNYDSTATEDDGSCIILSGGCSNPLAYNYSGLECDNSTFIEENCEFAGCICPEAYNYDSTATVDDPNNPCFILSGGCSDPSANNYSGDECTSSTFIDEDCQYAPTDIDFVWEYTITDANMTVQIGSDVVLFNGESPPIGSLIGAFFINDSGEYTCGGYLEWTGDQLALAVWASESGYDNGFEAGEAITWGLSIGDEDFLATSSAMNTSPPFSEIFVANGFGQLLSADFEGEFSGLLGCTDSTAYNYNSESTVDDGSCYNLDWNVTPTDCNMTILINESEITTLDISLNGGEIPAGTVIGVFYLNTDNQYVCAGSTEWTGTSTSVPAMGSESGFDNGFQNGEVINTWALLIGDQTITMDNNGAVMNTVGWSNTYSCNGFGNLLSVNFEGEYFITYGCTDVNACNYDDTAIVDDDSCNYEQTWYQDSDGDGLGNPDVSTVSCDEINGFVDNDEDPCPDNVDNPNNSVIWYLDEDGDGLGTDVYVIYGCTPPGPDFSDILGDPCPYNSTNTDEDQDGVCDDDDDCVGVFDAIGVCNGTCAEDQDNDLVCDDSEIPGCQDDEAFNYDETATDNDNSCCYIAGCTDSSAYNYNEPACFNDGSCIDIVEGCTNPSSFNYNENANTDDGSCVDYVFGCLDETACNYNASANTDNGNCESPDQYYNCDGNCLLDTDDDGVCDELEIPGCTDPLAFNYNFSATEDDGSCVDVVFGCIDSLALNYDSSANTDDENCCYIQGCTDSSAFNYNESACFNDGSCVEIILGCTDSSAFNYDAVANTDNGSCVEYVYGCLDVNSCNYDVLANTDNGNCEYPEIYYDCEGNCLNDIDNDQVCDENEAVGCTNSSALNYNPAATDDDFCLFPGCLDDGACNYDPDGFYYELISCEYESCAGCTNENANNYDADATIDDGSCIISGCTDSTACNYDPTSTDDDGSCYNNDLGCGCDTPAADLGYDCDGNCLTDADADGVCDEFEIAGCIDATACNYDSTSTDDDGSCYNNDLGCGCDTPAADSGYDCNGNCLNDTDGDGVCDEFEIVGCTDSVACNYNSAATDDGSCEYTLEGYDCDGNELELDSPWGNNDGCDPFNTHTVGFTVDGLSIGDFVALFYTDDNGDLVFTQAVEYAGDNFYFTVCGDDGTTEEKDGFDIGESFIWQLWPVGEDCAYTIDVEYAEGQPSSGEYEVNGISEVISFAGSALSVSVSVTDALCNGDLGSAELTITGGTAPYETDDLSSLSAGSYSTTVTDANGCSVSLDFEVLEPALLEASVSVINWICNSNQSYIDTDPTGSAELTITGGTAPYEIDDLSALSPGSYSTIVTDANGCSLTLDFEVLEPELLEVSVLVTDALCNGDLGSAEFTITGGTAPYMFFSNTMDPNPMYFDVWENPLVLQEYAGSYSYGFSDSNGCLAFVEVTISESELLEASVSVTDALCNGDLGSAELIVNGGTAPYEIDDLSALSAGPYTTIVNDANGCSVVLDFEVLEPELLEASVSVNDILCNGDLGSAELTVSGGTAPYEMDDLSELEGGVYTTTVTDSNGCENSVDFVITEPDPIEVVVATNDVSCNGQDNGFASVEITGGTGEYDYEIQTGSSDLDFTEWTFIDNLNNLSAGDYVITTVDQNGCFDITEFSILEPEQLSLILDSSSGEYSNCASGTASVFVEGGTSGYNYLWSNGATTSELTGLCGGEYSVIVTDSNGCVIEGAVLVDYLIPDGWSVSETDLVHTIDIPIEAIMLLDQSDLIPGDYVGVFFNNEDGTQTCGGYVMLVGESTQLLVYGDDGVNNGFEQGEQFDWRVWSADTETEAFGFAVYDESYADERYFNEGGESGLIGAVFATYQMIPLNENPYSDWDMISTYMSAEETVQSIFSPVSEELIIMKDANGLVYWPDWDINTLTNLNTNDAYAVKTWGPNEIMVYGEFIQPEDILFNLSGWNYISYPRYFPEDVDIVLSGVEGNIKLLKDDSGNLYWPELGLNTIGEMESGEGYILKVLGDQNFTYPSNSDFVDAVDGATNAGRYGLIQPSYYSGIQKTNLNMTIGLPIDSWFDFDIQYGDELAVFDAKGNLVGVSVLENGNNGVVVWADDESSQEKDGMLSGEEFVFQLWQESSNTLFDVQIEWKEGFDYYNTNGINISSIIRVQEKYNNNLEYVSCYPNPNAGEFSLEFSLHSDDHITISIFNSIGEKVYVLNNQIMDEGVHSFPFSLSHLTQGLYYVELRSTDNYKNIIIDITK